MWTGSADVREQASKQAASKHGSCIVFEEVHVYRRGLVTPACRLVSKQASKQAASKHR